MQSILKHARKEDIKDKHFPYIIIKDAIDEKLYQKLDEEYPSLETFGKNTKNPRENVDKLNNSRVDIPSVNTLTKKNIVSDNWREFVKYHTSNKFYLEVVKLFKKHILKLYPNFEKKIGCKIEDINTDIRFKNSKSNNIELECQISMNTPVKEPTRVRGLHIDNCNKLFVGLFYMRKDGDTSEGGDLEIYKVKDQYKDLYETYYRVDKIDPKIVKKIDTVKYNKNVFILFINSRQAIHAVSVRQKTDHIRRLINFTGTVSSCHSDREKFKLFKEIKIMKKNKKK